MWALGLSLGHDLVRKVREASLRKHHRPGMGRTSETLLGQQGGRAFAQGGDKNRDKGPHLWGGLTGKRRSVCVG